MKLNEIKVIGARTLSIDLSSLLPPSVTANPTTQTTSGYLLALPFKVGIVAVVTSLCTYSTYSSVNNLSTVYTHKPSSVVGVSRGTLPRLPSENADFAKAVIGTGF